MKRYALFIYEDYEAHGGFNDFYGSSDCEDELLELANSIVRDEKNGFYKMFDDIYYMQIADMENCKVVKHLKWNRE